MIKSYEWLSFLWVPSIGLLSNEANLLRSDTLFYTHEGIHCFYWFHKRAPHVTGHHTCVHCPCCVTSHLKISGLKRYTIFTLLSLWTKTQVRLRKVLRSSWVWQVCHAGVVRGRPFQGPLAVSCHVGSPWASHNMVALPQACKGAKSLGGVLADSDMVGACSSALKMSLL